VTLPKSEEFEPESVDRAQQRPELFSASNLSQSEKAVEPYSNNASSIVAEATIQLLEERLVVNRHRRKVGEVIIRKEIETRIVEVPIRREKLIVEQVSPETKELLVVDLGETQETDFKTAEVASTILPATVEGRFTSIDAALQFLQTIANQPSPDLQGISVILALKDDSAKAKYQRWLEKGSNGLPLS
jgi:Domain of unknown function (DUF2382)